MLALLAACTPDDDPVRGELTDPAVTPSEVVPAVFEATWGAPGPGRSWVDLGLDSPDETRTPESDAPAVRLVGLKAGRTYLWRPSTRLAGGETVVGPVGEITVPAAPFAFALGVSEPEATVPGGYVVSAIPDPDGGWVAIADGEGDLVWWYDTGHAGVVPADLEPYVDPAWDGATVPGSCRTDPVTGDVLVQFWAADKDADVTTVQRIPIDVMRRDEITHTRTPFGHHDFAFADGRLAYLAYEVLDVDGTVWASDAITLLPEGTTSTTPTGEAAWSWFDDFPAEPMAFDPLQESFFVDTIADAEWTHSNSLMPAGDAWFVLSKYLDAIVMIDRTTGALVGVIGGPYGDFELAGGAPLWTSPSDTRWSHAHMSDLWFDPATGTGGFAIFDNGFRYPAMDAAGEGWSSAVEFTFDVGTRTVEEVWRHWEPDGGFTGILGDVRKLPSGNRLVSWATLGRIEEIAQDGRVLWGLDLPDRFSSHRLVWVGTLRP